MMTIWECVIISTMNWTSQDVSLEGYSIALSQLPLALLQLRNQVVSMATIREVMLDLGLDMCDSFFYNEFKMIYRR